MNPPDQGSRAEGVGVAYHPFLHDALLTGSAAFDFVELPLDLYLDTARAALLDPAEARLDDIIGTHRCVWRGTELSLGSVETAMDPRLIRRIRRLLEKSAATHYTDVIGFRRLGAADLGTPQHMPRTEAAARWIGTRQRSASEALGVPVRLQLAATPVMAPPGGWDEAAFLHGIAAASGCDFVFDTIDLSRMTATSQNEAEQVLAALPTGHMTVASASCGNEADWASLSLIAKHANLHSIVLRRDRNLFPLDTIGNDVARANEMLQRSHGHARAPAGPVYQQLALEAEELAALRMYQSDLIDCILNPKADQTSAALAHVTPAERDAVATRVGDWRNWHGQVTDIHKGRQMAALLSPRTGPPGPYRVEGRG